MRRTSNKARHHKRLLFATFGLLAASALPAMAQTLRIGLAEDPDILDPSMGRSFVGRIVFNDLCDKLLDITPDLKFVPRLATAWQWSADGKALTFTLRPGVKFQNGETFDASAVKADLERDMTMPESVRKAELGSVASIDVVDPLTVRLNLKAPDASLLATLTDRAGMMFAPQAAATAGNKFGLAPVCSGPFKFVERVQQDHITLEADPTYWNAKAFHFDRVIFRTIADATVRLANLRSGDLDMIERIDPPDVAQAKSDPNLVVQSIVSLGYEGLTFNIANGDAANNPFAKDKRLRQAVNLAIDRDALNQVVFEGQFTTAGQAIPVASPYHSASFPPPAMDIEKAKALVKAAGFDRIKLLLETSNAPRSQRVAEVVQAMLADANIDVEIKTTEFATQLADQLKGAFQSVFIGWSGRPDPDGDIHDFMTCKGGLNDGRYCNPEVDKLLDAARASSDFATRNADYEAAQKITLDELPIVFLYYDTWIWGLNKKIQGFTPVPDGMIRLDGMAYAK